ncbi:uncharacterized protein [Haliotis cracherodii]|uniref:uncharacterized protein n=1 Tax=Haliotis cracherodii TaxID=6455 RepID=UPI0039EBD1A2
MASFHHNGDSQLLVHHLEEVEQQLEQEEDELLVNHSVEVEEELSMVQHLDQVEQEVKDDMSLLEHLEEIEEDLAFIHHMDDVDRQPEQQGGGAVPPYFLRRVTRQRARRFRANAVNFNVQFNPAWLQQQRLEDLPQALWEQFDNIIEELRIDVNGQDKDRETAVHVPNLCVVQLGCGRCIGDKSTNLCEGCPWRKEDEGPSRTKVFRGDNTLEDMGGWLLTLVDQKRSKKRKRDAPNSALQEVLNVLEDEDEEDEDEVLVIDHNYRGYDGHLLLQYFNKPIVVAPQIVLRGQQILMMKVGRLTFKDSLNFLSMPLKSFPKTFGLSELSKGYFPHFFNTTVNKDYVGAYPPMDTYGPDSMSSGERETFITWYEEKVSSNAIFNMSEDILSYCQSDVDILRRGSAAFRYVFIGQNNVDPFLEATTLPMACMLVFRQNYLDPQTIAIIPPHGYRPERRYSIQCLQWLRWLMHEDQDLKIEHARNGGEAKFLCSDGSHYSVDGYDRESKTVFEFMGCFWHGCTKCYKAVRCEPHPTLGTTMREVYQKTLYRLAVLSKHKDVEKIVQIWECEFKDSQKTNPELKGFLSTFEYLTDPLDTRDAFFGGRTNATKLHYTAQEEEEIKYVDVCSLYPYICKYGKYPLGHPMMMDHPNVSQLNHLEGLIRCRILPPSQLYHPLLPYRAGGKLMFPLCRSCTDGQMDGDCRHTDEERAWVGTYTTIEVQTAVRECGYRVLHIFEPWHFDNFSEYSRSTHQGGLFAKYVACGLPEGCTDPQDYAHQIYQKERVTLDVNRIMKNPGLWALAKGCLNNHWGKFGQRLGFGKASFVTEPDLFFAMLRDERHEVKDVLIVNENMLFVSTEPRKDFHSSHPTSNVVIAAWVTAQARLKLYSYLMPLEQRVLYFDTDSIIYVHKASVWNPPLGDTLGDLTDELDGNSISTFVSGGPKNYAYKLVRPTKDGTRTLCKVRGFTLNYRASQQVNFDTVKELICGRQEESISVDYPNLIVRTGFHQGNQLLSVSTAKKYRMVYTNTAKKV